MTLPNTLKSMTSNVFMRSNNLKELTIPASVTQFEMMALDGFEDLTVTVYKGSAMEEYVVDIEEMYGFTVKVIDAVN